MQKPWKITAHTTAKRSKMDRRIPRENRKFICGDGNGTCRRQKHLQIYHAILRFSLSFLFVCVCVSGTCPPIWYRGVCDVKINPHYNVDVDRAAYAMRAGKSHGCFGYESTMCEIRFVFGVVLRYALLVSFLGHTEKKIYLNAAKFKQ